MKKLSLLICCLAAYTFSNLAAAETPKPDTPSKAGRSYPLDEDPEDDIALKAEDSAKKFFYNDPCEDDEDCAQPHYEVDVHLEGPDYPHVKPIYKPKPKPKPEHHAPAYVHKPVYYKPEYHHPPSYAPVYHVPEPIYHQPIYYPHFKPEKPQKPEEHVQVTPQTNTTQTSNSTQNATGTLISQVQQSVNSSFTSLASMWAAIKPQLIALQKPKEHVFHHHHYYHGSDEQKPNSSVNHYHHTAHHEYSHPPPPTHFYPHYPHGVYKPYYRTTNNNNTEADKESMMKYSEDDTESYYRYRSDEGEAELIGGEDHQPGKTTKARPDTGSTEKTTSSTSSTSSESSKPSKGHKTKSNRRAASDSGFLPQLLWPFSSKSTSSHSRRQSKAEKE